jgi:hypothetical protein
MSVWSTTVVTLSSPLQEAIALMETALGGF